MLTFVVAHWRMSPNYKLIQFRRFALSFSIKFYKAGQILTSPTSAISNYYSERWLLQCFLLVRGFTHWVIGSSHSASVDDDLRNLGFGWVCVDITVMCSVDISKCGPLLIYVPCAPACSKYYMSVNWLSWLFFFYFFQVTAVHGQSALGKGGLDDAVKILVGTFSHR